MRTTPKRDAVGRLRVTATDESMPALSHACPMQRTSPVVKRAARHTGAC